jgi:hypothetical protein
MQGAHGMGGGVQGGEMEVGDALGIQIGSLLGQTSILAAAGAAAASAAAATIAASRLQAAGRSVAPISTAALALTAPERPAASTPSPGPKGGEKVPAAKTTVRRSSPSPQNMRRSPSPAWEDM